MAEFLDVCRFTPTAGGTTDWTFAVAATGYQSPAAAGAVNGAVYRYRAESTDLSQWEIGYGAYNSSTGVLARTTVLFNSSGTTSKISFTAAPQVAIVALAEDLPSLTKASNTFTGKMTAGDGTVATSSSTGALVVSGGVGVGGSIFASGNVSMFTQGAISATSDTAPASLQFNGQTGRRNWLIGNQYNVTNSFEITPSTTNGGTTFTTPVLKLNETGAAAFSAGVQGQTFLPTAAPGTAWGFDCQNCLVTVPASSSVVLPDGAGAIILTDATSSGNTGLYLTGGVAAALIGQTGAGVYVAPTTTPAANKYCVAYNGTHYAIYNGNAGGSISFYVAMIRARPTV